MWRATYPFSGTVYVFRATRPDRVKLVFWDGTGVVLDDLQRLAGRERGFMTCDPADCEGP